MIFGISEACNNKHEHRFYTSKKGWLKFPFWPLALTLHLSLFSLSHCLSSFAQALLLSFCWQVLAGRFGGRGQINTPSNSCQLGSSVCGSVWVCRDLLAWHCIHYSFLPSFLPHIYQPAFSFYLMRVSINIYCDGKLNKDGTEDTGTLLPLSDLTWFALTVFKKWLFIKYVKLLNFNSTLFVCNHNMMHYSQVYGRECVHVWVWMLSRGCQFRSNPSVLMTTLTFHWKLDEWHDICFCPTSALASGSLNTVSEHSVSRPSLLWRVSLIGFSCTNVLASSPCSDLNFNFWFIWPNTKHSSVC